MRKDSLNKKIKIIVLLCLTMLAVHVVNLLLNGSLQHFGIYPREITSLPYIFSAVFIHGSWAHLLNNLFGFCIFSSLCLLRGSAFFLKSSLFIIILTGLLVWLFARSNTHIGASGWIFGLWSLSIALAWFQRSFSNIAIALFVLIFYGGMIYGVLPTTGKVSFESHLFGALAGIICAWYFSRKKLVRRDG